MLLISFFAFGQEAVCTQCPGWEAKALLSLGSVHQLVQGHREHCEHFLPPGSMLKLSSQWPSLGLYRVVRRGGQYRARRRRHNKKGTG